MSVKQVVEAIFEYGCDFEGCDETRQHTPSTTLQMPPLWGGFGGIATNQHNNVEFNVIYCPRHLAQAQRFFNVSFANIKKPTLLR